MKLGFAQVSDSSDVFATKVGLRDETTRVGDSTSVVVLSTLGTSSIDLVGIPTGSADKIFSKGLVFITDHKVLACGKTHVDDKKEVTNKKEHFSSIDYSKKRTLCL